MEEANLIVGILSEATYTSSRFWMQPGERILLTTDGITEIEDKTGQQLGIDGLATLAHTPSLDALIAHLSTLQASEEAKDDWTLLDVRYKGK